MSVTPQHHDRTLESVSSEYLHLILLPTEACNFRCIYCYEDFRFKRMESWVISAIKALLTERAAALTVLNVSWFGGEPLLAHDVIEDVMTHLRDLLGSHPSLRMSSDATTNGFLLTPDRAERLVDLGVSRYQISFDGPRELHDRKRVLAGGKGTFDRIWTNLIALRDLDRDFTITIRVHVDRENMAEIPRFIDDCADAYGHDSRFEMFLRGLSRLGGPNDAELAVLDRDQGEAVFQRLRAYADSRGLRVAPPSPPDAVCYAARGNSFVIRANGNVNKCTVSLGHPNNHVGRIRQDGTLHVDPAKMVMWMRGLWSGDRAELKCPMKGYAEPGEAVSLAVRAPVSH